MLSWWINFKPELNLKLPRTFRDDVYQLLMQERNLLWCQKLKKLSAGHYVVAVALYIYMATTTLLTYLNDKSINSIPVFI